MRYKLLGRSGLRVAELALGTMTFGEDWGWGASKEEASRIFDAYTKVGGNFIDSACNYTNGTAERFVGEFIASDRDHFVVATKYTLTARRDDPNAGGNSRKNMTQTVEASLNRLNTDTIDLLWLHMWDFTTPIEEVLRGFDDLVRQGKVQYIGFSDTPAWVVAQAVAIAELRGWTRPVAVQFPYSLSSRDVERDILPAAHHFDLAATPWGLLNGGVLTGKYRDADAVKRYGSAGEKTMALADEVTKVAQEIGRTPSQVVINWVRQQTRSGPHPAPIMIPILGARTEAQIKDNLGVLDFALTDDQMERLTALSPIKLGFPHDFLSDEEVRGLIFGDTYAQLDNHRA
jgi:aryl-alcohol dehydrogenase-like predicted oxidoreductase